MDSLREKYMEEILEKLQKIDYIKPNELPNIDLYMDQVTTFMDKHLESSKRFEDDKLLTKTMINNYTKNDLLPSPDKKKYTKDHMYLLIFIYYMKNILSIRDIQKILHPLVDMFYDKTSDALNLEKIYAEVFEEQDAQAKFIARDLIRKLEHSKTSFSDVKGLSDKEHEYLNVFSFVCMLCFDVYLKKQMIESLIDEHSLFQSNEKDSAPAADSKDKTPPKNS